MLQIAGGAGGVWGENGFGRAAQAAAHQIVVVVALVYLCMKVFQAFGGHEVDGAAAEPGAREPCADVLLRMPEWISSGGSDVQCKVGDLERAVSWEGRYVRLGPAANGDRLVVTFPIAERTVKEHFGNGDYALTIRGTTVIAIDPPGLVCPLYQRNGYRAEKAHWSPVHRFVANNPIDW